MKRLLRRRSRPSPDDAAPAAGGLDGDAEATLSNEEFLRRLYTDLLGREPDAEGLAFHLHRLDNGTDPRTVFGDFLAAPEYQAIRRERQITRGLFAPPGHFYSPIVDPEEIRSNYERLFRKVPDLDVIDLRLDAQEGLFRELAAHARRLPFTEEPSKLYRYYYGNPSFGHGDGRILATMLLHFEPRRIIEVGSGYSTCLLLDMNDLFFGGRLEIEAIEPFPELLLSLLRSGDRERLRLHESPVQEVGLELYEKLGDGDFLFIDSTHVSKAGSDVNHHLFNVLPSLARGVFIHFHDIFHPFVYPPEWLLDENRSWNETYALRAFLSYNDAFKIIFFNDFFTHRRRRLIADRMPGFLDNSGGSLWLRKTAEPAHTSAGSSRPRGGQ